MISNRLSSSAIGGAIGLALLMAAFGYRWFWHGSEPLPSEDANYDPAAAIGRALLEKAQLQELAEHERELALQVESAQVEQPVSVVVEPERFASEEMSIAISKAKSALSDGRLILPERDNALHWYQIALEIDPQSSSARNGLNALVAELMNQAHAYLDGNELENAQSITNILQHAKLAETELVDLAQRIEKQQEVNVLLAEATEHLRQKRSYLPEENSALDSYRKALEIDPKNSNVQRGIAAVEKLILSDALTAASEDHFEQADNLLAQVAALRPSSKSLLSTRSKIIELRHKRAQSILARAVAALDANNLAGAERFQQQVTLLDPQAQGLAEFEQQLKQVRLYEFMRPGQQFSDPFTSSQDIGPEMMVVALGEFLMGSPNSEVDRDENEGPRHRVVVSQAFALARHEVSVQQFQLFVRETQYQTDAEKAGGSSFYDENTGRMAVRRGFNWKRNYNGDRAKDNDPVVHVSWNDANAYAQWLAGGTGKAYRIPSEAEFEYALRAGSQSVYWWGDKAPRSAIENLTFAKDRSASRRSWNRAFPDLTDGYWGPAPVASFAANAFGLYDMAGNVSEWVADCWHESYVRAPEIASAWVNRGCKDRVVRGGSWGSAPEQVRSAYRTFFSAEVRSARMGFRVARNLGSTTSNTEE